MALLILSSGKDRRSHLQQIKERGSLTMITRNGPSSYFIDAQGDSGFEYEMVRGFSDYLGVELAVTVAPRFTDMFPMLEQGLGDMVAANITKTPERMTGLRFGPEYHSVTAEVVYRRGGKRPRRTEDLLGNRIRVLSNSSYESMLQNLQQELPDLVWQSSVSESIHDLFEAITDGEIDFTVVDSTVLKLNQPYFPRVRRGFSLSQPQPLAWVFPSGNDDSLAQQAREYFAKPETATRLETLRSAYYDQDKQQDPISMVVFMQQVQDRLPDLMPMFAQVADQAQMDWRLLAAVGYQESHWDPAAVSRTGVRGIMMLTQQTARQLGLSDREDPLQSIQGGARYIQQMLGKVPERITGKDRLWLALAAYNIGWGHLEDARVLTQKNGGNPDRWQDVSQFLPRLAQEPWYSQTRYGYARGYEAVQYVTNIRNYYETLVWMDTHDHPLLAEIKTEPKLES